MPPCWEASGRAAAAEKIWIMAWRQGESAHLGGLGAPPCPPCAVAHSPPDQTKRCVSVVVQEDGDEDPYLLVTFAAITVPDLCSARHSLLRLTLSPLTLTIIAVTMPLDRPAYVLTYYVYHRPKLLKGIHATITRLYVCNTRFRLL